MPADQEQHVIEDEQRKYWTQMPNVVWEFGLPLQAWSLYTYVKRRAGNGGECWQSTRNIASTTGISRSAVQRSMKLLTKVGLIKRELKRRKPKKEGEKESGWKVWHVRIVDIWPQNMAYFRRDEWAIEWVANIRQLVARTDPGGATLQTDPGWVKTDPQAATKNIPKENTLKECDNGTGTCGSEGVQGTAISGGSTERTEAAKQQPKIMTGTGDTQQDTVDAIGAGVGVRQAKALVAEAMYKVLWPTLEWPTGKGKSANDARAAAQRSADRVLERIGRAHYQDALDACHLLMTEPTEAEDKWLGKANTVYALVDTVTSKVNHLREKRRIHDAHVSWNEIAALSRASELPDETDGPEWWPEVLESLRNNMPVAAFNRHFNGKKPTVADDGTVLIPSSAHEWANERLRKTTERALSRVRGEPSVVRFVDDTALDG